MFWKSIEFIWKLLFICLFKLNTWQDRGSGLYLKKVLLFPNLWSLNLINLLESHRFILNLPSKAPLNTSLSCFADNLILTLVLLLRSDAIPSVLRRPGSGLLERAGDHRRCPLVHWPHVPHQTARWHPDAGQRRTRLHHKPHGKVLSPTNDCRWKCHHRQHIIATNLSGPPGEWAAGAYGGVAETAAGGVAELPPSSGQRRGVAPPAGRTEER